MQGRCCGRGYRFGFQGQETDTELFGGAISYKYRVHDPRIGRFLSVDPLSPEYPFYSPYAFSGNRVIDRVELEGLEPAEVNLGNVYTAGDQEGRGIANGNLEDSQSQIAEFYLGEVTIEAHRQSLKLGSFNQVDPGFFESWGQKVDSKQAGFLSNVGYSVVNEPYVLAQQLTPGSGTPRNLSGRHISGSESVDLVGALGMTVAGPLLKPFKAASLVDQYALRAATDDFYPVMTRGFAKPTALTFLKKGEVWKFGITKNPTTRYSQTFLDNTGGGLRYTQEFQGTRTQALTLENMKILNFEYIFRKLPAGNKIRR